MFPSIFETDWLRFERFCHANLDLFEFYRICSCDPGIDEVTKYLPWQPHTTPKETKDLIDRHEAEWNDAEDAIYVIRIKGSEASDIAGVTGMDLDWERRTGTLRLWLRKRFWGRGYSGERAKALLNLAFERLDLELVAVKHVDGNEKSKQSIEKYIEAHGGQYDGVLRNSRVLDNEVVDEHRYSISQEQYREAVDE